MTIHICGVEKVVPYIISMDDDGTYDLPNPTSGFGIVQVGDNEEYARFTWTEAGVVTLLENTSNVASSDLDDKFCIFDNGAKVTFKNRLAATKTVKYMIYS